MFAFVGSGTALFASNIGFKITSCIVKDNVAEAGMILQTDSFLAISDTKFTGNVGASIVNIRV